MVVFGVVYLILNTGNGKRYVGQTVQPLEKRFNAHAKCKKNMLIGKAIRKYGKDKFRYGVIKSCASKEEMDYWEKYFIVALKSKVPYGYNMTDGGEGTSGLERTPEYLKYLSESRMGEKNPRYGKKNTPEHTARIVAACKGRKTPPETCKKIAASHMGEKFTQERCANISISKRGDCQYKNLIAELDAHKLSYSALARLMGLSEGKVSLKMTGKRNFTERDKIKLVEIFGKPIEYLLACESPPEIKEPVKKKRKPYSQEECARRSVKKRGKSPYKNLIAELDAHQFSYKELERRMGVAKGTIARKIRGEYNFSEEDKEKLVEIFNKPIEYLLARSED